MIPAIITRPGAASRRGETAAVAESLGPFREVRLCRFNLFLQFGDGTGDEGNGQFPLRIGRRPAVPVAGHGFD